jgi:hypothetical protein
VLADQRQGIDSGRLLEADPGGPEQPGASRREETPAGSCVPAFGQDKDYVYVGDIYSVKRSPDGFHHWNFRSSDENSIAEIPRNSVLLSSAQYQDELYNGIDPPACSFLRRLGWRSDRPFCD